MGLASRVKPSPNLQAQMAAKIMISGKLPPIYRLESQALKAIFAPR